MNNQESILREKLKSNYGDVFEDKLVDEIIHVGYFDKILKGELLIDIGQEMTHIPLILEGIVKIVRKDQRNEEIVLYFLESGNTCAISFANCLHRNESIFKGIVEKDMEAIFLPVEIIDEWLVKHKSWRHFIIDSYHFRLLEMVESIDSLAFLKMNLRVLKYLSDKAKLIKGVDLDITHQAIADDLHTSRVVVTRIIKELHEEGKIYSSRNSVKVLKPFE